MRSRRHTSAILTALGIGALVAVLAAPAFAGFAGTDLFIPMAGIGPGDKGSQWFTTLWVYNPSSSVVSVSVYFLKRTANNTSVTPKTYTVNAGETKMFPNIVGTEFGFTNQYGALRVTCATPVVAVARVFAATSASAPLDATYGQDFSGVPPTFAIGSGDPATEILGGYTTSAPSAARYNIGFVEVTGHSVSVTYTVKDATGANKATFVKTASPFDQAQGSFANYFPGVSLDNARIEAQVTAGSGRVILYGSQIANTSNDPTTFEMAYPANAIAHQTGLFHGAIWSTDGLVIEGGLEAQISAAGVVTYSGSAGLQCGDALYTLDFSDTPASPLAIDASGNFTAGSLAIGYEDGGATVFTTTWTLAGNRDKNGILTGTLRSDTTGGTGDWAACNGTNVVRNWRAGWTKNPA
jgi:hypothetical protein